MCNECCDSSNQKVIVIKANLDDACSGHHAAIASCCGTDFQRRFTSSGEKLEKLEKYRTEIENELQGVNEELKRIKGE